MILYRLLSSAGLESAVKVNIIVQDINDNQPELMVLDDIFVCENDESNAVRKDRLYYRMMCQEC